MQALALGVLCLQVVQLEVALALLSLPVVGHLLDGRVGGVLLQNCMFNGIDHDQAAGEHVSLWRALLDISQAIDAWWSVVKVDVVLQWPGRQAASSTVPEGVRHGFVGITMAGEPWAEAR